MFAGSPSMAQLTSFYIEFRSGKKQQKLIRDHSFVVLVPSDVGVLDREGNARKVVNCSCVVVRDWGEESQERSVLLDYFQRER